MAPEKRDVPGVADERRTTASQETLYSALMVSFGFALLLFVLISGADWLAARKDVSPQVVLVANVLVAVLGGLLLMKVMTAERARVLEARAQHQAMLQRLEMIAELNHHVRNALEMIQLSAHTTQNKELIQNIHTSVTRIQWALRELLPPNGEPEGKD
ncbi:MAG: hypothetical protein ACE14M_11535 [Terriglobales bacterium]